MKRKRLYGKIFAVIVLCSIASLTSAQDLSKQSHDSTIVFGTIQAPQGQTVINTMKNSWGVNLLVSTGGFGMGTFYRHEYSDDFAGFIDFSICEASDDNEKNYIDPYTGQTYTPGEVNRFLVLPVFVGIEQRLFADDILDNFRPYVTAAAGPTMIYVFPYNQEYFSALGNGQAKYTAGGYIGFGAYFGSERTNVLGMNIRYYYIPYPGGLQSLSYVPSKTQFGGFFISLSFGTAW